MLESCAYKMLVVAFVGRKRWCWWLGLFGERGLCLIYIYRCRKHRWCSWKMNISVLVVVELEWHLMNEHSLVYEWIVVERRHQIVNNVNWSTTWIGLMSQLILMNIEWWVPCGESIDRDQYNSGCRLWWLDDPVCQWSVTRKVRGHQYMVLWSSLVPSTCSSEGRSLLSGAYCEISCMHFSSLPIIFTKRRQQCCPGCKGW